MSQELSITFMNGKVGVTCMCDVQEIMDNEPIQIIPNLYLGSRYASFNRKSLNRLNVKYVVNCSRFDYVFYTVRASIKLLTV